MMLQHVHITNDKLKFMQIEMIDSARVHAQLITYFAIHQPPPSPSTPIIQSILDTFCNPFSSHQKPIKMCPVRSINPWWRKVITNDTQILSLSTNR